MNQHVDEDAELYPLGVLDDVASRNVRDHIADCAPCAARVEAAQLVAASLAAAVPAAQPSSNLARRLGDSLYAAPHSKREPWQIIALAAALVFALAGLGVQTMRLHSRTQTQDDVVAALVQTHFRHVALTPRNAATVRAKVLYAPDGSWIYIVIADRPPAGLHAVAHTCSGGEVELGTFDTSHAAAVFLRPAQRIETLELRRGSDTESYAKLTY